MERQHEGGRLTARERIARLLDPSTFVEMNMLASLPEDYKRDLYGDGVVVGYGKIDGRKVCIYSQDYTVKAGTTGPVHRSKITGIIDRAVKTGVPVIGSGTPPEEGWIPRINPSPFPAPLFFSAVPRLLESYRKFRPCWVRGRAMPAMPRP